MVRMSQTASSQIHASELSLNLGILVGLLLTDGCASHTKSNNWKITFTNKSEKLHRIFLEKMSNIFEVKKFHEWFDSIKSTEVQSKEIFNHLMKLTPTFRTKPFNNGEFPNSKIPEFIMLFDKRNISKVLRVMFSADGSVCFGVKWHKSKNMWQFTRRVKFSSKHPAIKQQIAELLKRFELNPETWEKEVVLERRNDLIEFKKEIGFIPGVKVTKNSKNWDGFEKNQILNLLIKSFKLKKKDLQQFKTKEEVINFLKRLL